MANKIKKVSVNELEKYVKSLDGDGVVVKKFGDLEVTIRRRLPLQDMLAFVNDVVNGCFSGEGNSYLPEVKEFLVKSCVLEYYTNVSLPANIKARYELIYKLDGADGLINSILSEIDREQYFDIINALDEKIGYLADSHAGEMADQVAKLINSMGAMQEKLGGMFDGVDQGTMQEMVRALSGGRINEEGLARAVMKVRAEQSVLNAVAAESGDGK